MVFPIRQATTRNSRNYGRCIKFLCQEGARAMAGDGGLLGWAERSTRRRACMVAEGPVPGRLRFVFYGRVSTEDWQDPVTSRVRQRSRPGQVVRGHGLIVAEFFDVGLSPDDGVGAATAVRRLVAQLADPAGGNAVVIGEYERAFYGSQYAAMAPLLSTTGSSCGCRKTGGRATTRPSMMRRR